MAAAAAASLLLPSSVPKSIPISARPTALALTFSSSKTAVIALPKLFMSVRRRPARAIIPRVVLQSEFDQEEEEEASDFSLDQKLFVGNLPFHVDSAELAGLFERAGNVEMVEVIYDKMTGKSRGFGFVTMSTAEEVEAAVEQFNGYELQGRPLRVNCGPPPPKDEFPSRGSRSGGAFDSPNRVYVGNLPWSVDNLALETLFSEQGKVTEAKVVYDRDSGRSRGFGFVTYSSAAEVNNAISSLDGFDVDGRSIRVSVAEARPRR